MIRFAQLSDVPHIMDFIDTYWKKGHILARDHDFFLYQYFVDDHLNFVLSVSESGEIDAILGFIPYGREHRDVMLAMWKANHTTDPSLGLELFRFLQKNGGARIMASPGSNKKLRGLYRYLGYDFGAMRQWYRLNPKAAEYSIAKVENRLVPDTKTQAEFVPLPTWDALTASFDLDAYRESAPKPYKEPAYLKRRYYEHPVYRYLVYGVCDTHHAVKLLLVFRKEPLGGACALRLVDCIGDFSLLSSATGLLDTLLAKTSAEYVDCYEIGLDEQLMLDGGWLRVSESGNIIPNYFSPFVQENIDVFYFSSDPDVVLFKGDGDQDRPS